MSKSFFNKLKGIDPNITSHTSSTIPKNRVFLIDDARNNVLGTLVGNIEFVKAGMSGNGAVPTFDGKTVPKLVALSGADTYQLGVKYKSSWLPNVFNGSDLVIRGVAKDKIVPILTEIGKIVKAGKLDKSILAVHEQFTSRGRKAASARKQ